MVGLVERIGEKRRFSFPPIVVQGGIRLREQIPLNIDEAALARKTDTICDFREAELLPIVAATYRALVEAVGRERITLILAKFGRSPDGFFGPPSQSLSITRFEWNPHDFLTNMYVIGMYLNPHSGRLFMPYKTGYLNNSAVSFGIIKDSVKNQLSHPNTISRK